MNVEAYRDLTGYELRRTRDNWKGLCPVHSEKTPSFFIHNETYLCHCFGCGARGYVDNVLSRALEMPAREVRRLLGISVDSRLTATNNGCLWINISLPEPFDVPKLSAFPRISNHSFLEARGFSDELVIKYETRWDKELSRIVFPLRTLGGPIVGAVGRTVIEGQAKFHFYWTTQKAELLHCPWQLDTSTLIVVEGIFDAMRLNQCGYTNVVPLIGAEASPWQVRLMKDVAEEVILFLDNDKAGRMGQEKLTKSLRSNVKLSYARYPEGGTDPSELSETDIVRAIESRQTYVQFNSYY